MHIARRTFPSADRYFLSCRDFVRDFDPDDPSKNPLSVGNSPSRTILELSRFFHVCFVIFFIIFITTIYKSFVLINLTNKLIYYKYFSRELCHSFDDISLIFRAINFL